MSTEPPSMSLRAYFKEAIAEAKKPSSERGAIFHCCGIDPSWFEPRQGRKAEGRLAHMNDDWVDDLSESELKLQLALFIMNMYRQR